MKIIELFSGIGAQTQALKNLGISHTSICCEIDATTHSIYEAIHGKTPNLGDISKVEELPPCDLLTYSFPCQDLSSLGKQRGLDKNSNTRSSLLWEVGRLLENMKERGVLPETLLLENVKQLVSPKNVANFNKWLEFLSNLGYTNVWQILNAKDFGIPQHRERVFVVSSLTKKYEFATPNVVKTLKDFMDKDRDVIKEFGTRYFYSNPEMREKIVKTINNTQSTNSTNRIYGRNSISHALTTQGSHPGNFGAILYSSDLKTSYELRKKIRMGKVDIDMDRIRLATPREVFRLMGFDEKSYKVAKKHMIKNGININKFYHVSGNSIVVQVLESIFKGLDIGKK